jgi:NAD(P)-dependent dehydrogenase (short-subunit alcohol dehydrogenase family)
MGGQHGYGASGASAPLGGTVVGFAKTYKRERLDSLVKAVDFSSRTTASEVAQMLIDETLRDPAAVEIGYKDGLRWTIGLKEEKVPAEASGITLDPKTVFLITGAAGSIVSAITADLAAASGGTFYLLDVVSEPDADNQEIKRFKSDKDGLKRDLFARIQARGERATPALVEKELASLERAHALLGAINAVRDSGGKVRYFRADLNDAPSVSKVVEVIRQEEGRIDVLLHAAGLERSHLLPEKEPREFDLVFGVKANGWFNLLHAIGDMPLGATVAFSSIAGRFGNAGQADYSAANDLLCKLTSNLRLSRPATRAIAIDWTAWGGIGMASRGSIPKMMEVAGIDMLAPEAGVPIIRRELTGASRGEVLIAQRLGVLLNEWDEDGGIDRDLSNSSATDGLMVGKLTSAKVHSGVRLDTILDPKLQPFLNHHRIEGTPVLPGVMGIEFFAEATARLVPGYKITGVEDVNFLAPFKFYRDEPRTVTTEVLLRETHGDIEADCRLVGSRTLSRQAEPQVSTHFTGRVRLSTRMREPDQVPPPRLNDHGWVQADEIYRVYFHGPAYRVLGRACRSGNSIIGELAKGLPPDHIPAERPLVLQPRLLELCFQSAGLLEIELLGHFGLPQHVDRVQVWDNSNLQGQTLLAIARQSADLKSFEVTVVDVKGNVYIQLAGYRTIPLPGSVDREPLMKLHAVAA